MVNDIFYAIKYIGKDGKEEFSIFYNNSKLTFMCTNKDEGVYKVRVRPVKKGEASQYWGWHEFRMRDEKNKFRNQDEEYCMIWPSKMQAEMCFTYGYKVEEDAGKGKLTNFAVEELEKAIQKV